MSYIYTIILILLSLGLKQEVLRPELDLSNVTIRDTDFSNVLPANADVANIAVDAVPYMSTGPGRFANGSQFDLVRAFFGLGKDEMLTDSGKNSLDESATLIDLSGNKSLNV